MGKKVAILQSNYIPWKGYFDIINMVDELILYDDMQYTRYGLLFRLKIKVSFIRRLMKRKCWIMSG